jgi:hypothetical protein
MFLILHNYFYFRPHFTHQPHSSGPLQTPHAHPPTPSHHPAVQLHCDWCSAMPISTPHPRFSLLCFIPLLIPPLSALLCLDRISSIPSLLNVTCLFHSALLILGWELLNSHQRNSTWVFVNPHWCFSARIGASLLSSTLLIPTTFSSPQSLSALKSRYGTLLFHAMLQQRHLPTALLFTALPIWRLSFPGSWSLFSSKYTILPFKPPF